MGMPAFPIVQIVSMVVGVVCASANVVLLLRLRRTLREWRVLHALLGDLCFRAFRDRTRLPIWQMLEDVYNVKFQTVIVKEEEAHANADHRT